MAKKRILKGFVFGPRRVGLGRITCMAFFRYESHAKQVAARWPDAPDVERATLTLPPPKRRPVRDIGERAGRVHDTLARSKRNA